MLQLSADFSLPTNLPGAVLTADAKGGATAFVDLLGLALEGQLGALQDAGLLAGKDALALFSGGAEAALPEDTLAQGAQAMQPLSGQELAMQMFASMAMSAQAAQVSGVALPEAGSETEGLDMALSGLAAQQKKLPPGPAELAAAPARLPAGAVAAGKLATQQDSDDVLLSLGKEPDPLGDKMVAALLAPANPIAASAAKPSQAKDAVADVGNPLAQTLSAQMSRPSESVSAGGRVSLQMMAPVASSEWRAELGDKLSWLVGRQAQTAELVLNPPSLGTIEVRLNMNMSGNETGAQFFTANANVRDALEAAFPRLRELLAGAGITLGDTTVSSQSFAQQREQAQTQGSDNSASQPVHGLALGGAGERFLSGPGHLSGLVDLYI